MLRCNGKGGTMPFQRGVAVAAAVALALLVEARPTRAQQISDPPNDAPVQTGPLTLSPTVRLWNFGYDQNVYSTSVDSHPKSGVTATLTPMVEGWLRLEHLRVSGRTGGDFYYVKNYSDLNGIDTDTAGRVDIVLNRLAPYVTGTLVDTRHRQGLEIDSVSRRRNESVRAGADLRLTENVFIGAYAQGGRLEYAQNSLYLGTDLARQLNHTSTVEGFDARYKLTPFTTFALAIERQHDGFDVATSNNADSVRISPAVEFSPLAVVSGAASIGFRRFKFLVGGLPDFNGTTASVDLNYTLLGQTRFGLQMYRDLEYSYFVHDYLATQINVSVTERIADAWEVGGLFGRARLSYGPQPAGTAAVQNETAHTFGGDVGYRLNRVTIGLHADYGSRRPDVQELYRGYERLRFGSTLTYRF
jgi:hypothetical protein